MDKISIKELLAQTGISYGQLYRWKREGLIPEEWFIKQSAFTGQETFFPKDQIMERVAFILREKDSHSLEELAGMLIENSDEPYAEEIAKAVVSYLKRGEKIETTTRLKTVIEETLSFLPASERKEAVKKSCQRTLQAPRLDVNSDFEVL